MFVLLQRWTIGRCLDQIARQCSVPNSNATFGTKVIFARYLSFKIDAQVKSDGFFSFKDVKYRNSKFMKLEMIIGV